MFELRARLCGGFHVALVIGDMPPGRGVAAFQKLRSDTEDTLELGDWRTAGYGMVVAHEPLSAGNRTDVSADQKRLS